MTSYNEWKRSRPVENIELIHRMVVLEGEINERIATEVIAKVLYLQSENRNRPIELHLSSPGGEVTSAMAILDTMDFVKNPILTYCFGCVSGVATLIAAHGAKGYRRAAFDSRLGLTPITCNDSIAISQLEFERIRDAICQYLIRDTRLPHDTVRQSMQSSVFFSSYEARDFGLVDHVGPECRVRNPSPQIEITRRAKQISDQPI